MKAGIKDVAKLANVSIGTVSKVFNPDSSAPIRISAETRERILKAAQDLDYKPNYGARMLRGGQAYTIGFSSAPLKTGREASRHGAYYQEILAGLVSAAEKASYNVLVMENRPPMEFLENGRIDGMIFLGDIIDAPIGESVTELYKKIAAGNYPYLVINDIYNHDYIPSVSVDNEGGMRSVMEHLYNQGARKFCFAGSVREHVQYHHKVRESVFRQFLQEKGLEYSQNRVIMGRARFDGDPFLRKDYCPYLDPFIETGIQFDALVCANDHIALDVMNSAEAKGLKIPESFKLTGFDCLEISAFFRPPLTTVRQPFFKLGDLAFEHLRAMIKKETQPEHTVVPTELVIRKST